MHKRNRWRKSNSNTHPSKLGFCCTLAKTVSASMNFGSPIFRFSAWRKTYLLINSYSILPLTKIAARSVLTAFVDRSFYLISNDQVYAGGTPFETVFDLFKDGFPAGSKKPSGVLTSDVIFSCNHRSLSRLIGKKKSCLSPSEWCCVVLTV